MRRLYLGLLLPLAACSSIKQATQATEDKITEIILPHKIEVRQGNFVSQEMVAQLKPGLTRDQVRFILGTPLVADPFHANRWDYYYSLKGGETSPQQRHLIVYFEDGRLVKVGGDVAPNEPEVAASESAPAPARVIDVPPDPNGPKTEPDYRPPEPEPSGKKKQQQ